MIKNSFIISFYFIIQVLFSYTYAASCDIKSYKKILILPNKSIPSYTKNIFLSNECSHEVTIKFLTLLTNSKGILTQRYINEYFKESEIKPNLINNKIKIVLLKEILESNILLKRNLAFFDIKHVSNKQMLPLKNYQNLDIKCENCHQVGTTSIYINFRNNKNQILAREILSTVVKQKVTAFFPKKQMNIIGKSLKLSDFTRKVYYTIKPRSILNVGKEIVFYKSNKQLSPLTPIKVYDITAINLISYGQQVKATLKSKYITLEAMGIANDTGSIGQNIRLKVNNKILTAKIVNFNKVEILQ